MDRSWQGCLKTLCHSSYIREATHKTDHGRVACERCATVAYSREATHRTDHGRVACERYATVHIVGKPPIGQIMAGLLVNAVPQLHTVGKPPIGQIMAGLLVNAVPVAFGRDIWRLPAIMQAYRILESALVEGKAMIIQGQNRQLRRGTILFWKVNIALQMGGEEVVNTLEL